MEPDLSGRSGSLDPRCDGSNFQRKNTKRKRAATSSKQSKPKAQRVDATFQAVSDADQAPLEISSDGSTSNDDENEEEDLPPKAWLEDDQDESALPPNEAEPAPQPCGAVNDEASPAIFEPRCSTAGHRAICEVLLPVLLKVMRDPAWSTKVPREQVRQACDRRSART